MSRSAGRVGALVAVAVLVAGVSVVASAAAAPVARPRVAATAATTQVVTYGAYRITVPASWPVVDLAADPTACVRFNRNAVYLGVPGATQACPAHNVGVSDALLLEPSTSAWVPAGVATVQASTGSSVQVPAAAEATHRFAVSVPDAGVTVLASFSASPTAVATILSGASSTGAAPVAPQGAPGAAARPQASTGSTSGAQPRAEASAAAPPTVAVPTTGLGFDACTAPTLSQMAAWKASPYSSVGVYIGGANRGCAQPNLTAGWVRTVTTSGWALLPIYVGRQSPTSSCGGCLPIEPSQALHEGYTAALDAVGEAQALGIGPSSPIFYDMEGYNNTNSASVSATMTFLAGWTATLHSAGYRSGVYSSAASGISDLAARLGTSFPEPDELWIARWDGKITTSDPAVPANHWVHQRAKQYVGQHNSTHGGVTLSVDSDVIDAPLAAAGAGPYVERTYQQLLGRAADSGGFQYWTTWLDFGGARGPFTSSLVHSWEFDRYLVAGDYQRLLSRVPDAHGQDVWAFLFAASGNNRTVAAALAASDEFWVKAGSTAGGFVNRLYQTVLGRSPGSAAAYWVGLLNTGASRASVARAVIASQEAVSDVVQWWYQAVVGHGADAGGLAYWTAQIQRTGDPRPLLATLTASQEAWLHG